MSEKAVQPKTFYVGIKGVVINPQTRRVLVLITERSDGTKRWDLPGGRINHGENYQQALERELKEEVPNIHIVKTQKLVAVYQLGRDLQDGQGLFLIAFKVETDSSDEVELSEEHVGYRWLGLDEIDSLASDPEVDLESDWIQTAIIQSFSQS